MIIDKKYLISLMLGLTLFAVGCTTKFGTFEPNNRFAFPNSNVEPIGPVSAEVSKTGYVISKGVDKAFLDEVMNKALQESGGDLIINYKLSTITTIYPIPIIGPVNTKLRIEGTACKMTVGRQELK